MIAVSITQIARWLRCRREWHYHHELRCRPIKQPRELGIGIAVHAGLETYLDSGFDLRASIEAVRACEEAEIGPYDRALCEALIVGHDTRWCGQPLRVLAVELPFSISIAGATLRGKIDAIVEIDGRQLIMEHKTTSSDVSSGSIYWQMRRIDPQISAYYDGARSLGYDPQGCVYNVLVKPGCRPRKATPEESRKYKKDGSLYKNQRESDEDPSEYFDRIVSSQSSRDFVREEIVRLEPELEAAREEVASWVAGMIRGSIHATPSACMRYGGRACPYLDICPGLPDEDDPRFTFDPKEDNKSGTIAECVDGARNAPLEGFDLWS